MSELIKRLQTWPFENGNRLSTEATFSLVNEAISEIERLRSRCEPCKSEFPKLHAQNLVLEKGLHAVAASSTWNARRCREIARKALREAWTVPTHRDDLSPAQTDIVP